MRVSKRFPRKRRIRSAINQSRCNYDKIMFRASILCVLLYNASINIYRLCNKNARIRLCIQQVVKEINLFFLIPEENTDKTCGRKSLKITHELPDGDTRGSKISK